MLGQEGNEAPGPNRELRQFANTLYSHLYFFQNMQPRRPRAIEPFKTVMLKAILRIDTTVCDCNYKIFSHLPPNFVPVAILGVCDEVCRIYPNDDYFKKLYFVSTFILEFVTWNAYIETLDLGLGPFLWVQIFVNHFENEFEGNGGWQGFANAAEEIVSKSDQDKTAWEASILPASYADEIISRIQLIFQIGQPGVEELAENLEQLALQDEDEPENDQPAPEEPQHDQPAPEEPQHDQPAPEEPHHDQPAPEEPQHDQPVSEKDQPAPEEPEKDQPAPEEPHHDQPAPDETRGKGQIENPQEGTSKQTEFSRVVTTQQSSSRVTKRKHGAAADDSDTECDAEHAGRERSPPPASPERKKIPIATLLKPSSEESVERVKKTLRKRRHDSDTKDSDEEPDSPTSSKAKMEKK